MNAIVGLSYTSKSLTFLRMMCKCLLRHLAERCYELGRNTKLRRKVANICNTRQECIKAGIWARMSWRERHTSSWHSIKVTDNSLPRVLQEASNELRHNDPSNNVMRFYFSQAVGRRYYRSRRHSCGFGSQPQRGAERTDEEDAFRRVQDVMLRRPSQARRVTANQSRTFTVLKLVFFL